MPDDTTTQVFNHWKLWERRLRAGLSRARLSDLVGCSPDTINEYEHGVYAPSAERLGRLATALGCEVSAFFTPHRPAVVGRRDPAPVNTEVRP